MSDSTFTPEDVPVCNCAGCYAELLGAVGTRKMKAIVGFRDAGHPIPRLRVAGRIMGRPYCRSCLSTKTHSGNFNSGREVTRQPLDNTGPSFDNALRALEGE